MGGRLRTGVVTVGGAVVVTVVTWLSAAAFGHRGSGAFVFAWVLHFAAMAWISGVVEAARPPLDASWFRVRRWEPRVYRWLGAWWYARLLRAVGWERMMGRGGGFGGTRAALGALDRRTRRSEIGHLVIAVLVTVVSAVAAWTGAWDTAVWLSGLTVVLHVYPVLLQRALRARIQRLR